MISIYVTISEVYVKISFDKQKKNKIWDIQRQVIMSENFTYFEILIAL